jgi:tRNA/rRNA methyltransferase
MDSSASPVIILVRPQIGENIGMSARAAYNGGLTQLRLVNPKEEWPNPKSVKASAGAHVILDDVKVFDSLESSISDLHYVLATSARPRDMTKYVYNAESAIKKLHEMIMQGHRVGIMFGPERTGLDNEDLSRADGLIEIPMNPDYTSLNLAQAVLILAYEWIKLKSQKPDITLSVGDVPYASKQEMIELFDHLEHELDLSGFLRIPHKRDIMVRNIRNMFLRVGYTSQEVRTLRGIIASLVDPYNKDRKKPTDS